MKRLKRLILLVAAFYLLVTAAMYLLQEKLIFLPTQLPSDYTYQFAQPFDEFDITADDGAVLNALHFKNTSPKGVILYFHGNAGDLSRWGHIVSYFYQYQYDVIVMDYRTYGKSTGQLNEDGLYNDAQLFYDKAASLFPEEEIVVYGRSLGTTFATKVAAQNNPKQLVLESPFYDLKFTAKKKYWYLPVKTLLKYSFPTAEFLQKVDCPVTIFHGTADSVVPYENGEKLYNLVSDKEIQLISIEGGDHNDLINFSEYTDAIPKLLD